MSISFIFMVLHFKNVYLYLYKGKLGGKRSLKYRTGLGRSVRGSRPPI